MLQKGISALRHTQRPDDTEDRRWIRVKSVGNPNHGTTRIVDGRVLYTPAAGYVGDDHFSYTASTGFGSDQAPVTITVSAAPPPPTQPTSAPPTAPALANTGTPDGTLLETGLGLLLAGGATTVAGRRRRRGRRA